MKQKIIDKAIETLKNIDSPSRNISFGAYGKAYQLGIEALERLVETRKSNPEAMPKLARNSYLEPLPSETEAK